MSKHGTSSGFYNCVCFCTTIFIQNEKKAKTKKMYELFVKASPLLISTRKVSCLASSLHLADNLCTMKLHLELSNNGINKCTGIQTLKADIILASRVII